jgi:hypothetical protein
MLRFCPFCAVPFSAGGLRTAGLAWRSTISPPGRSLAFHMQFFSAKPGVIAIT